jgi:hypothetical protein
MASATGGSPAGDAWLTAELLQILQEEGLADGRECAPRPTSPALPCVLAHGRAGARPRSPAPRDAGGVCHARGLPCD